MNLRGFVDYSTVAKQNMKYRVQFVGYSAYITHRRDKKFLAVIDFMTGATSVFIETAEIFLSNACEFLSFASSLSDFLKKFSQSDAPKGDDKIVDWVVGENKMTIDPPRRVPQVVQRLGKNMFQLHAMLQVVQVVGSQIERRPHSDFLSEVLKEGYARIELHGIGIFSKDGLTIRKPKVSNLLAFITTDNGIIVMREEEFKKKPSGFRPMDKSEIVMVETGIAMAGLQAADVVNGDAPEAAKKRSDAA